MNFNEPFGVHHSHYQPRRADGTFISYERAGRRLGRHAVSTGHTVVVAGYGVRFRRAAPAISGPALRTGRAVADGSVSETPFRDPSRPP